MRKEALSPDHYPKYTHHFGDSMSPHLQNRDILEIKSTPSLKKGDIVLFKAGDDESWVAHRIIMIEGNKIWTKGDNNLRTDDRPLRFEDIAGIVTARWRHGKRFRIHRGRRGQWQCYQYRFFWRFRNLMRRTLGNIRMPALAQPLIERILPPPREISFTKQGRRKRTLYLGKTYIGSYSERRQMWQIRFPYRIFIRVRR